MSIKISFKKITISAPGRICLFGEHQDYLGLPVITAAINLRISIQGTPRQDRQFILHLPDIGGKEVIDLNKPISYIRERDYFRSGLNVLSRNGIQFPFGYDCLVRSTIPINSGTSSSSALQVAWIKFLLTITSDKRRDNLYEIASLAHQSEVVEFNEPGGKMDHYAASFGDILYIDFNKSLVKELPADRLGLFVLGDSLEPKKTKAILKRVKEGTLDAFNILHKHNQSLTINTLSLEKLQEVKSPLSQDQYKLLESNIIKRQLTWEAKNLFIENRSNYHQHLGSLLNAHQKELREGLQISTPKIDTMIDAALNAGAMGAKINGSGGGGCMFAYAPDSFERVAEAIKMAGGKSYIVSIDRGVCLDSYDPV